MRRPPPVAPRSLMLLEPGRGKLRMVCLLNNVLLYNIMQLFPGSSDYLDGLLNVHTAIWNILTISPLWWRDLLWTHKMYVSEQYKLNGTRCCKKTLIFTTQFSKMITVNKKKNPTKKILDRMSESVSVCLSTLSNWRNSTVYTTSRGYLFVVLYHPLVDLVGVAELAFID